MKKHNLSSIPAMGMSALTYFADTAMKNKTNIDDIIRFIHEDFPIRTLEEELSKTINAKALDLNLTTDKIIKILKKKCGDVNVKNWLSGKSKKISKESALKVAFALKMDYYEASEFLTQRCWLDGLYMRDYKDFIYRFCLNNEMDYEQAEAIIQEHSNLANTPNPNAVMSLTKGVTAIMDESVKEISTKDGLDSFIKQNGEYFGTFRRTAHELFMGLYNSIKENEKDFLAEDVPTDEEICKLLSMGIPALKGKKAILSDIIKKIAEDSLPRTVLSEIAGKTTEVKRKHLLLMWLYVNAGSPDMSAYPNRDAAFEEFVSIIDDEILKPCGMPLLDPRHPLDWVIMNAIYYDCSSDDSENEEEDSPDTVERIRKTMEMLFDRSGEDENTD